MRSKISIIIVLFLTSLNMFSQELDYFVKNRTSNLNFHNNNSTSTKKASSNFFVLSNQKYSGMQINEVRDHKRFKILNQTHNNVEIYSATIKINYDNNDNVIFYNDNTINYKIIDNGDFPEIDLVPHFSNIKSLSILESKKVYYPISENEIIPALKVFFESDNKSYLSIFNKEYDIIYNIDLSIEKDINTRTANALVFMPDPITSAETVYGGNFAHNNGISNSVIEAEQKNVTIECKYENGIYYLENDFVKIVNFSSPNWGVVTSADGNFNFNRSQIGFQQVNAFYHINSIKKLINSYGFIDAVDYAISVDADGEDGDDNSHFHSYSTESDSRLEFGAYYTEGSKYMEHVPDAEDAEVVVHEYTHAIINSYSRDRDTYERQTLEEAMADYIAVSYATGISEFNWQNVFKWDGHNEFWAGRKAVSTKCYNTITFSSIYEHTDIWVAPLMDLFFEIGKEKTDKLVLHTITGLDRNTSMEQAALIMMKMDSTYNNHENAITIFNAFKKYCILNDSHLADEDFEFSKFKIINSLQFAKGGELTINFGKLFSGEVILFSINGVILKSEKLHLRKNYSLSSENLNTGIYIIKIKGDSNSKAIKVWKH
jgi:hypothetical protein